MESEEHLHVSSEQEGNKRKRRKVFMACIRCRDRKISCDGTSPACCRCVSNGLHCEYVAVRKMRGPGKKWRAKNEEVFQRADDLDNGENNLLNYDGSFTVPTEREVGISEDSSGLETRLRQKYPVFAHPENAMQTLQDLKRAAQQDQKSPEGFAPLVSQDLIDYMLKNTYEEISEACPIFDDLPTLNRLNAEQHAVSNTHPGGNPARWAILSTWIALAMSFRTVSGSEDEFSHVIKAYSRNAVLVLPDLILQPAKPETIQALLFMTVLAGRMEDHQSFVMLVTNASRQIELLALRLSGLSDRCEREFCQRLLSFVCLLAAQKPATVMPAI